MQIDHSIFSIQHSVFCTRRVRRMRGTALIETAIILPLYMLVLFGIIYFGYATLSKQRQTIAASGAAWTPGVQDSNALLDTFWREAGASTEDVAIESSEEIDLGDTYYGNIIPSQLVAGQGSLGGGGDDTFDRERVAVSLWNLALGEVTQSFSFEPGEGFVERITVQWDSYSQYLNTESSSGTGWINAGQESSPDIGQIDNAIADAFNGLGDGHWLERRQVAIDARYSPPFLKQIVRETDAPTPDFATYISGDYPELDERPTVEMTFDLTSRGSAERYAVGEGSDAPSSEDVLRQAADLLNVSLSSADEMDATIETLLGSDAWLPQ